MQKHKGVEIPDLFLTVVVVVVISYLIMQERKATAAAKKKKIKMLVTLAAEEAVRVEAMAKPPYTSSVTASRQRCAICLTAATTRCSRCKAVRYCSGKCQIIHWRQGHKQECRQPDICNSSTSASCVSTLQHEPDSLISLSETRELRPFESDLHGLRTSDPAIPKVDPSLSVTAKSSASELCEVSAVKICPEVKSEISDFKCVNVIDSIPKGSHSSTSSSPPVVYTKDAAVCDIPSCESSVSDELTSYSGLVSNILSSDVSGCRNNISNITCHCFTNSVNGISCSKIIKTNYPVCKSHADGLPVSSTSLDNLSGSRSSEHTLHSSARLLHDLPCSGNQIPSLATPKSLDDLASKAKSFAYGLYNTKDAICHSSGIKSYVEDACRSNTVMPNITSNVSLLADSIGTTCVSGISSYGVPFLSSCRLESSDSSKSSSKSSTLASHGSSSSAHSTFKLRNCMTNELSTRMPLSEIESPRISASSSTNNGSFGASVEFSYPHRVGASVGTISSQMTESLIAVSSDASHTLPPSHQIGNGLKAFEKKIVQQAKHLKPSKQTATGTSKERQTKLSKMLFPYEYFVKLFDWDELDLPPCGLINCGNSCYANVVLQCLTYTRPLAAYLLQRCHSEACQVKEWCLMCELEHLVSRVREGKSPLTPIRILSQIQNIGNNFGHGSQEDAHEFLRFVINILQLICLDEAGGEKAVEPRMQETTFIQQIFGGYLQSKIKCMRCLQESERYENMMDLMVEINGNIESLEDALSQFTAPELLDGENMYKCCRCKAYVKARKWLAVHEAPNILTIALKRFQSGKFGKLNKCITFPDVLDMTPYMSGKSDKPPLYKLYAVVVHLDILNASFLGHYICYVKNLHGNWYKIDDSEVKAVELDRVMSEGAYMLLYSRSSPRAPVVAMDKMTQPCTAVTINHCTYLAEKSLLLNGHDKRSGVCATHFSSFDISDSIINGSSAMSGISNGVDAVHMDVPGYNCDRVPLIKRDRNMDSTTLAYSDLSSSDAGSLFSGSDEASCSTDSNRDSTSTVDYAETVFGDSETLTCSSFGLPESSCTVFNSAFCIKSSLCPPQTKFFYENGNSFNQQLSSNINLGKRRHDQGVSLLPDSPLPVDTDRLPAYPTPCHSIHLSFGSSCMGTNFCTPCLSSRHHNRLDCRTGQTDMHAHSLQAQNRNIDPYVSETGSYSKNSRREDYAIQAKPKFIGERNVSNIFEETERIYFNVSPTTFKAVANFECCSLCDSQTSCSGTIHSLGFEN